MADAFIYDHVRTPRGRGKPDGSLHTATTLHLAATALKAIKERNHLAAGEVDDVVMGCVDPVGEAGGDIARMGALAAGLGDGVPGVQINRFCASGLDWSISPRRRSWPGQHDLTIGGGVEFDEPRRHRRLGRRLAGRSLPRDSRLFHAAGRLGRPHRHQIRLLARRRRRPRRRVAEAHRRGLEAGRFKNSIVPVRDVNGLTLLDRDEHMRPSTDMQSLACLKPSFVMMGEQGGFDAVAVQAHPEVERINHVHHAGNSSGIVDGAAAVLHRLARGRRQRRA